jgi:hypothetical protein
MAENFGINPDSEQTLTQPGNGSYNHLVDNHAAQLMDELFHDLDGDRSAVENPSVKPSALSPRPSAASQLALSVKTDELQDNLLIPYVEMDAILEPYYAVGPVPAPPEAEEKSFLLPGLAWGAFLGSVSLFAFTQFNLFTRSPETVQAAVPVVAAAQPQDVAFAAQVTETLQSTENILPSPSPLAVNTPAAIPPTAPPVVALATQPAGATPPSKLVGKDQKTQVVGAVKLQQPPTIALSTINNNRLPVLNGNQPQVATAYAPPALPASLAPQALPMGRQAKSGVTINTILDLGTRSAILISRNGSTQNVRPGEVVDSTGWVFVQVKNGQAILQRGNETRTVGIGEQF